MAARSLSLTAHSSFPFCSRRSRSFFGCASLELAHASTRHNQHVTIYIATLPRGLPEQTSPSFPHLNSLSLLVVVSPPTIVLNDEMKTALAIVAGPQHRSGCTITTRRRRLRARRAVVSVHLPSAPILCRNGPTCRRHHQRRSNRTNVNVLRPSSPPAARTNRTSGGRPAGAPTVPPNNDRRRCSGRNCQVRLPIIARGTARRMSRPQEPLFRAHAI